MPWNEKTEKLLSQILKKIKPSEQEIKKEQAFAQKIMEKIRALKENSVEVTLAGSIARNTHLRHGKDMDIFVLFPKKMERKEFEKQAMEIGKKVSPKTKWEEAYSEHPYVRGQIEEHTVEIVPSYKVEKAELLQSSVDRSPFHTEYLKAKLSEKQKDDIRLLRQFLKGINAYGAEIKTESFPGYVTELLVLHYGSFRKTLESVSSWKKHEVIDIEKQVSEKEAQEKFESPLVVIDPVDKNRNVAAALSLNQMARFVAASREFLKNADQKFFFGKKEKNLELGKAKKLVEKEGLIVIETGYPKTVSDIAWGQLKRFAKKLHNELRQKEFVVLRREVFTDEKSYLVIVFDLQANELEQVMKRTGPEVFDTENSKNFLLAHKKVLSGPRIEDGKWTVEIERKEWVAQKFVEKLLANAKKTEKEQLKNALKKKAKVLGKKEVLAKYKKDKAFQEFFSDYLKGKEGFL